MLSRSPTLRLFEAVVAMLLFSSVVSSTTVYAQTIEEALFSPDVSVTIGAVPFDDDDVAFEDFSTPISTWTSIPLDSNVDLSAYHLDVIGNGHTFFVVDITTEVGGPLTIGPQQIVEWDYSTFSVAYDVASLGLPAGVRIDALTVDRGSGEFVVSFDTTVALGPTTFHDEDLVKLSANSASLFFDGSAAGLSPAVDVDGAALLLTDEWLTITLDTSGTVGGVAFDDEDILLHHPTIGSWYMAYDASAWAPEMEGGPATNAIFVPEPSMPLMLVAGMTLFAALRGRRGRWRPRGLVLAWSVAALMIAADAAPRIAHAADGVIEINQAAVTSFPYVISQPGSYMLTSDLSVANLGTPAIRIDVHDVTLDLNGFSIQYVFSGGPAAAGIDATGRARIRIRDGRVKDFVGDCVVAGYLVVISDVVVTGCGENGLELGSSATVRHVGAHSNGNHGIETGPSSRISDSLTSYNTSDGVHGAGKFTGNVSTNNGGHGFLATTTTHVTENSAHTNGAYDLEVGSGCPMPIGFPIVFHARNMFRSVSPSDCLAPE